MHSQIKRLILLTLTSLLLSFSLTACDADTEDVEDITDALKKQNIIDDDFELVDQVREISAGLFITRTLYYIYQNQDSDYIAITYEKTSNPKTIMILLSPFTRMWNQIQRLNTWMIPLRPNTTTYSSTMTKAHGRTSIF